MKEFSSFHDNDIDVDKNNLITTKNPFLLNGEEWKTVRGQISPCYTTNKVCIVSEIKSVIILTRLFIL